MDDREKMLDFALAKAWDTEFTEGIGRVSLDGSWILYQSDASGRYEVYVQPYSGPGRVLRASTAGGLWPRWSADGTEIYYQNFSGILMAVPVRSAGSGLTLAAPVQPSFDTGASCKIRNPPSEIERPCSADLQIGLDRREIRQDAELELGATKRASTNSARDSPIV